MFVKNVYITIWDFADSDEGEEVAKLKAEKEAAEKYKEENFIKPEDWQGPR